MNKIRFEQLKPKTLLKIYKLYDTFYCNEDVTLEILIDERQYTWKTSIVVYCLDEDLMGKLYKQISWIIADEEGFDEPNFQNKELLEEIK